MRLSWTPSASPRSFLAEVVATACSAQVYLKMCESEEYCRYYLLMKPCIMNRLFVIGRLPEIFELREELLVLVLACVRAHMSMLIDLGRALAREGGR